MYIMFAILQNNSIKLMYVEEKKQHKIHTSHVFMLKWFWYSIFIQVSNHFAMK